MKTRKIIAFILCIIICFPAVPAYAEPSVQEGTGPGVVSMLSLNIDSAYETMAVSKHNAGISYNPNSNSYLSAYQYYDWYYDYEHRQYICSYKIDGYFINDDTEVYDSFNIYETNNGLSSPSLTLDSVNNNFMVTWTDTVTDSVYGRLITDEGPDNQYVSVYENVYGCDVDNTSIAFDELSRQYLVVWQEEDSLYGRYIVGQMLDIYGSHIGSPFHISDVTTDDNPIQSFPYVISTGNGSYLVVWSDYRTANGYSYNIYGRIIYPDGSKNEADIKISSDALNSRFYYTSPTVAYDNNNDRFLVAWANANSDYIYSAAVQMLSGNGDIIGTGSYISDVGLSQYSPSVSFDSFNNQFLVTWAQPDVESYWQNRISGRYVDSYDSIISFNGEVFDISGKSYYNNCMPSAAYNPRHANFLVSYIKDNDGYLSIGHSKVAPSIKPQINHTGGNIIEYDNNGPGLDDILVELLSTGNRLTEVLVDEYYSLSRNDDFMVEGDVYKLDGYNKYVSERYVRIPSTFLDEYFSCCDAGESVVFTFKFDGVESPQFIVNIVRTTEDSLAPTIINNSAYQGSIIPSSTVIQFSEDIHEYSRNLIEEAVMNNVPEEYRDGLGVYWDTNDTLTIVFEYSYYETNWLGDVRVEIMDYAGNTNTVTIIDTTNYN